MAAAANPLTLPLLLDAWSVVPVTRSLVLINVPDALPPDCEVNIATVAATVGADAGVLARAIRYVAGFGVFEECGDGAIRHTATSRELCSGGTLRHKLLYRASMESMGPYIDGFRQVLQDPSKSAFEHVHGEDFFMSWLPRHPETEAVFGQYMSDVSRTQIPAILEAYPWPDKSTIADVGGGNGHLLRALLLKLPDAKGVLFDRPQTIANARAHWPETDVMRSDRVILQDGDFFAGVDVDADIYVLKWILHDWADRHCLTILESLRAASRKGRGGKVIVIDMLVPEEPNTYHMTKSLDVHMAVIFGGRERTASQMRGLAEAAGWTLAEVLSVGQTPFSCFVLEPAGPSSGDAP
eukprot:NODE_11973_length_1254_cov_4.232476.p1 GENE.NODE_11973_length_1254_cov_4.232476~~NODE_11973_length_1254_cov_4.232476.p1  ORF type:complete len:375 (+),score=99.73 NODE_11973_length_1254_cov_4.232476:68-1126(+)